jgi:hypothetical protein
MTRSTIEDIDDLFDVEELKDSTGTELLRKAVAAVILGRGVSEARARFAALQDQPLQARPDNRLHDVAVRQATADILGVDAQFDYHDSEIAAGIAKARGVQGTWQRLLEEGAGLALRRRAMREAGDVLHERVETEGISRSLNLTLLLHVDTTKTADAQSLSELGFFAVTSASDATVDPISSMLALAFAHGHASFGETLQKCARSWDRASAKIKRSEPKWALDANDALSLTVTVTGKGSLRDAAPWALEDLVYRFPEHIDALMCKRVAPAEIGGSSKNGKHSALKAAKHGIEAIALLKGVKLEDEDRAALAKRQEAGLAWVRAHHPSLAKLVGKLTFVDG